MFICTVGFLGVHLVMYCKVLCGKHLLKLAWVVLTILAILLFVLAAITYTATSVIYELCDSLDQLTTNK